MPTRPPMPLRPPSPDDTFVNAAGVTVRRNSDGGYDEVVEPANDDEAMSPPPVE